MRCGSTCRGREKWRLVFAPAALSATRPDYDRWMSMSVSRMRDLARRVLPPCVYDRVSMYVIGPIRQLRERRLRRRLSSSAMAALVTRMARTGEGTDECLKQGSLLFRIPGRLSADAGTAVRRGVRVACVIDRGRSSLLHRERLLQFRLCRSSTLHRSRAQAPTCPRDRLGQLVAGAFCSA